MICRIAPLRHLISRQSEVWHDDSVSCVYQVVLKGASKVQYCHSLTASVALEDRDGRPELAPPGGSCKTAPCL